jgi:hypothetical protein
MSRKELIGPYGGEPSSINYALPTYKSDMSRALNWYAYEKEKKDARSYLRSYISQHYTKNDLKVFDRVSDKDISTTLGFVARMIQTGSVVSPDHEQKVIQHCISLLDTSNQPEETIEEVIEKIPRPSVRDNMVEKVREYLGELDGAIDDFVTQDKSFDLYTDLKSRAIPQPYCPYIETHIKEIAAEYISVYESTDPYVKEAYSNFSKRKLTQLIKMVGTWAEDLDRYAQFKKANRKPRVKKAKPPSVQVAKLKYKREDIELKLKSVNPTEMVGASQVWIYNTKYKKLAVYRTDSNLGIQIKGTTLQNYDPDQCEQKTLRKPQETIKKLLEAGKVQLRRILSELSTKESIVNGRINEECVIVRVIK